MGRACEGDKIASCHTGKKYEVTEIGIMHPEQEQTDQLRSGQVGYIACNMKESSEGALLHVLMDCWDRGATHLQHMLAIRYTGSESL